MASEEEARKLDLIKHAALEANTHLTALYNELAPRAFGDSPHVPEKRTPL